MTETLPKIKLYFAEEQEIFQKLYNAIFTPDTQIEIINSSAYSDFETIKANIAKNPPDILLIGLKHVSAALFRELRKVKSIYPSLGIIVFISFLRYDDLLLIRQHVENSKSPFALFFRKSLTRTEQIFSIISLVKMGQVVIDPTLSNLISTNKDKTLVAGGLTAREMEVLNLVAKGYTNTAISDTLCIDVKTVRHHINNMYSKLQAADNFDNRHPRVSATNVYLRLTGQLTLDDSVLEE